jgi:hypothetical protein
MTRWFHFAAAVGFLGWNGFFLFSALSLPAGASRGDVGPAELPVGIAVFGMILAVLYAAAALLGRESGVEGALSFRPLVFALLFAGVILAAPHSGLAVALAAAVALGVLLIDGAGAVLRAGAAGLGTWALAAFGFGGLLGLPLP